MDLSEENDSQEQEKGKSHHSLRRLLFLSFLSVSYHSGLPECFRTICIFMFMSKKG
jgi:hypothetical protein